MNPQEINEGTKLIAIYMGYTIHSEGSCTNGNIDKDADLPYRFHCEYGKFHSSWKWIMAVCKKWSKEVMYTGQKEYQEKTEQLHRAILSYDKELIFKILVNNIKWYNPLKSEV